MSQPKITLHWLSNSRAQRIIWLLEELGLTYEVKKYTREKSNMAPAELRAVHPLGKSPVLTIEEDGETLTLAESGAIVEYLTERFSSGSLSVAPSPTASGSKDRADLLYWLHWPEGSAMGPFIMTMVFGRIGAAVPFFIRPVANAIAGGVNSSYLQPTIKRNLGFVEKHLEGREYFVAGKLTGADILMAYIAEATEVLPEGLKPYPNFARWFERMKGREAWKKAAEVGEPVDMKHFLK